MIDRVDAPRGNERVDRDRLVALRAQFVELVRIDDAQGRVIGITSSIATISSGGASGSIGLGFAIPVNLAREVGQQLIEDGTAEHAFLGVSLSDGTATADGITRRGAVVEQVTDGSPAQSAELQTSFAAATAAPSEDSIAAARRDVGELKNAFLDLEAALQASC